MSETATGTVTGVTAKTQYKVSTAGYTEQFSNYDRAMKAFEREKSKRIRQEETFKIDLSSRAGAGDRWQVLDTVKIGEDYYSK